MLLWEECGPVCSETSTCYTPTQSGPRHKLSSLKEQTITLMDPTTRLKNVQSMKCHTGGQTCHQQCERCMGRMQVQKASQSSSTKSTFETPTINGSLPNSISDEGRPMSILGHNTLVALSM